MSEAKGGKAKGKVSGNFLKIVIIVILMIIAGLAGYFVFIKYKPAKSTVIVSVAKPVIEEASFSADEFTVNLADGSIMRTKIVLNYDKANTKLGLELNSNMAVRDAIIGVIRSKKSTELTTTKDTDDLKVEIMRKVNSVLVTGKIINVYYHDILIQ